MLPRTAITREEDLKSHVGFPSSIASGEFAGVAEGAEAACAWEDLGAGFGVDAGAEERAVGGRAAGTDAAIAIRTPSAICWGIVSDSARRPDASCPSSCSRRATRSAGSVAVAEEGVLVEEADASAAAVAVAFSAMEMELTHAATAALLQRLE